MYLTDNDLKDRLKWEKAGFTLPAYNRDLMKEKTKENPSWVHFGAGNIFRAFHAVLAEKLLNEGFLDTGIVVAEGFDTEIIEKAYKPFDDLSILVTLKSDGSVEKRVTGAVALSLVLDSVLPDFEELKEIFKKKSLKLATFTITEKGYKLTGADENYTGQVAADFEAGPDKPVSYIGKVTALLYERFKAGALPVAMVSTDNCSHNGEKLFTAVRTFAEKWTEKGVCEKGFIDYVTDENKVSFPWSMIDKITPRPDDSVREILCKDGLYDMETRITHFNTYVAPFVNAEECEYLVIEDKFPNGRPELEKVGVIFTNRDTVNKVERMKVTTCLNPLHTALAVYGCLLGFTRISDEMKDADLVNLIKRLGYVEGLPVVTDPGVLVPKEFIDTVVNVRLPNPFMPDTPQRIATDTSQKLSIRFGETIKCYIAAGRKVTELTAIPLVLAGWLRYTMGIDDNGNEFTCSPDPLLNEVKNYTDRFSVGNVPDAKEVNTVLEPLYKKKEIYGIDLCEAGISDKVTEYFISLLRGKGMIRETIKNVVSQ